MRDSMQPVICTHFSILPCFFYAIRIQQYALYSTYFTLFFYPITSCTKNATSLSLKKHPCLFYDRISVAVLLFSLCPSEAMVFDAFFHCHFPHFLSSQNGLWNCFLYYKYQNGCTIFRASGLLPLVNGTKKSPYEGGDRHIIVIHQNGIVSDLSLQPVASFLTIRI